VKGYIIVNTLSRRMDILVHPSRSVLQRATGRIRAPHGKKSSASLERLSELTPEVRFGQSCRLGRYAGSRGQRGRATRPSTPLHPRAGRRALGAAPSSLLDGGVHCRKPGALRQSRRSIGRRCGCSLWAYNGRVGLALLWPITGHAKGYPFELPLPERLSVTGVALADQVKGLDWRARRRLGSVPCRRGDARRQ
jgi:hypothetical protein